LKSHLSLRGKIESYSIFYDLKGISVTEMPLAFISLLIKMTNGISRGQSKLSAVLNVNLLLKGTMNTILMFLDALQRDKFKVLGDEKE